MKKIILLSLTLLFTSVWAQTNNKTSIAGKITDGETGEELIGAQVTIYKGGVLTTGASTDFTGNYAISLEPGTYDVEVSYIGFEPKRVRDVIVKSGEANKLDVQLGEGGVGVDLDEIVVNEFKVPLIEQDNTTAGGILSSEEITKLPTKNIGKLASSTAGLTHLSEGDAISVRGSRANGTDVYVDGIRVNAHTVGSTKKERRKSRKHAKSKSASAFHAKPPTPKVEKLPNAGQLTAGEWRDLDNWSFWDKLIKNEQFATYQDFWGFYPEHRFELKLSDKAGRPLANVNVNLLNAAEEVVWSTVSDNKGAACLWGNFFGGEDREFEFQVFHSGTSTKMDAIPYTSGLNSMDLEVPCVSNKQVDVAFVVDVTGSMRDELRYLKAEIHDVIDRAKTDEVGVELRTAAVYYAGKDQKQALNNSALSEDSDETINFMNTSPLAGGQSYEAVDQGLGVAIRDLDWNEDAMTRIVFILLDAVPFHSDEIKDNLHRMTKEAAEKGIKVIPVASSGANKSLEFLLKFIAMGTNSTYTFLTNHSGIGGNHIAPEAGSYNVENLNDLLVRLIIENAEYHDCETITSVIPEMLKTEEAYQKAKKAKEVKEANEVVETKKDKAIETNEKPTNNIRLFPNPASDHVNIDLENSADMLIVSTVQGKIIAQYPKMEAGQIRLQTSGWASGVYFVHVWMEEQYEVFKLVVAGESD